MRQAGDAIQIYWLSGYIFFGASERLFERIRDDIETQAPRRVDYLILDFSMVKGADTAAVASFAKLRNHCNRQGTTLVYSASTSADHKALEHGPFFGGKTRHRAFGDLSLALARCEDQLLARAEIDLGTGLTGFEPSLQRRLGPRVSAAEFVAYPGRKDVDGPRILYRQGEPADTIDGVAAGSLAVDFARQDGKTYA